MQTYQKKKRDRKKKKDKEIGCHVGAPLQPKISGSGVAAGGGRKSGARLGMNACRSCARISYKLGVCSLFSAGYGPIYMM